MEIPEVVVVDIQERFGKWGAAMTDSLLLVSKRGVKSLALVLDPQRNQKRHIAFRCTVPMTA